MLPDIEMLKLGWECKCPKCHTENIFKPGLSMSLVDKCPGCGLDLSKNDDSADGPAVFLIFILGFALVPLAILFEYAAHPPLWLHAVLWSSIALGLTLGLLRPLKAYIIALEYKHRSSNWD